MRREYAPIRQYAGDYVVRAARRLGSWGKDEIGRRYQQMRGYLRGSMGVRRRYGGQDRSRRFGYRKLKYGGYSQRSRVARGYRRQKPLNATSNFRKIVIRQCIPIHLSSTTNHATGGLDSYNGVNLSMLKFAVCAQPFVNVSTNGTTLMRHPVIDVVDGSGNVMGVLQGSTVYQKDIVDVMERYASFRVAGMKVELRLFAPGYLLDTGTVDYWNKQAHLTIVSAWDHLDTRNYIHDGTPVAPNVYEMERLSYYKEFEINLGSSSEVAVRPVKYPDRRFLLFSRRFIMKPGRTTIGGGSATSTAVLPGQWDIRAKYDTSFADAYAVSQDPKLRSGKLYVAIKPACYEVALTDAEVWNRASTTAIRMGEVIVEHEIWVRDDLDGRGRVEP